MPRWRLHDLSLIHLVTISFPFANAFTATSCSHMTAWSSAEWRRARSPSANLVCGHDPMMWLIVCTSPHWHLSDVTTRHLWRLVAHRPWPVRNWFSNDHVERRRLKPAGRMVGSEMRWLLSTEDDCQSALHLELTLTGVKSDQYQHVTDRRMARRNYYVKRAPYSISKAAVF